MAKHFGIQLNHKTTYNSKSNDLIERFHRQLNALLRAKIKCYDCLDALPWIILKLRSVPKEYLRLSSAEQVYGLTQTLPGESVEPSTEDICHNTFIKNLREKIGSLVPKTMCNHGNHKFNIPSQDLFNAE
ncbi:hypothetical protein RF11_11448 [Thelohanellus kitauei]|uniref:Integrase catalytic domain-containing protein n=1 Tax=Thelohanellus kitauei TaxID=669202 RepID=A0A0C2M0W1_THEKT|nr:hypothetical protein RF11_11448 [Thelohanellus kitauei]